MAIRLPTGVSLTEEETPIWFGQTSWASQWAHFSYGGILLIMGLIIPLLFLFGLIGLIIGGILAWINVSTSEYFISNRRIFVKSGMVSRGMNDLKMEWVTNTSLVQGFFGRILNFGDVLIATPGTGTGTTKIVGVSNPMMIKGMIEERLSKYKKAREIDESMRRITEEYKMGRLDEGRYYSLKQEYASEGLKYT